jgi:hypothetical protein
MPPCSLTSNHICAPDGNLVVQAYLDIPTLTVKNISFFSEPELYLKHERFLYTMKNGAWQRTRDYMVDTLYHALLDYMVQQQSRSQAVQVMLSLDRDWFLLLPLPALQHVQFRNGTFTVKLETIALLEEALGPMDATCKQQAGPSADSYVIERKPGPRSRIHDSFFFHIYLPVFVHYSPAQAGGDVVCISCDAARIHRGHILWSTRACDLA